MEKAVWIQKDHPDYDGMKWVSRAVRKAADEGEPALSHIEIAGSVAVACDGARLHEYQLTAPEHFPNGIYRPFVLKGNLIFLLNEDPPFAYPSSASLFPVEEPIKKLHISRGKGCLFDWAYTQVVRNVSEQVTVQIRILEEMLCGGVNWDVLLFEEARVLVFTASNMRGLIMPMG
jgi:hypothetical protein